MISERVASLKQTYLTDKASLGEEFKKTQDAGLYLDQHSRLVDALVDTIFAGHATECSLALFATGGYGRRELFPASDLDILVVFNEEEKASAESAVSAMLRELWDTGLDIGHQVWSLQELGTLGLEHYQFVLALLDSRQLGMQNPIGSRVQSEVLPAFFAANGEVLSQRLVKLANSRHKKFENTIYQLEPDLKTAPGGLRDLQTGRWLGGLVGTQKFVEFSEEELGSCETFLKRLRVLLHLLSGRNDNRLTHAMQEKVRNYLGYRSASARSAIEALMKEYFLNARISHSFCKLMLKSASPGKSKEVLQRRKRTDEYSSLQTLLEGFIEAAKDGHPLIDGSRRAVRKALPDLSSSVHFPSLRGTLKELFRPRPGLYQALSEMYSLGVLELLFPEFGSIKAQVVWDFYHRYTVDEHTLLAIRNIELLADSQSLEDGRFRTLLEETVDPSMLTLALLFHDVGKGRGGQHSDQGARMAARALRRFRFEANEIDTIVFLIQHHLAMSSVIFRRDLEDDQVIGRFADLVSDPEVLRLLTLLTYSDIKAVAPGTLNEWKRDLLWQLYTASYRKLTLGYGEQRVEEKEISEKLLAGWDGKVDLKKMESFLEGFPSRYLRSTAPDEIYQHYRMAERLNEEQPIQTRLLKEKDYYDLCVVTPDRSYLFAKIVGLLSYFEMNILRGYGFSNRLNTILDFFQFFDSGQHFHRLHEKNRFQEHLYQAIQGEISVERLLQGKEGSVVFRRMVPGFVPSLYFEDEHSDRFTILEIVAPDALGLLYRISQQISHNGCDIELALISTEGEKAIDVFYLSHRGSKLSAQLKENLGDRIIQAIT